MIVGLLLSALFGLFLTAIITYLHEEGHRAAAEKYDLSGDYQIQVDWKIFFGIAHFHVGEMLENELKQLNKSERKDFLLAGIYRDILFLAAAVLIAGIVLIHSHYNFLTENHILFLISLGIAFLIRLLSTIYNFKHKQGDYQRYLRIN